MTLNSLISNYVYIIIGVVVLYFLYKEYKKKSNSHLKTSNKLLDDVQCTNSGTKYNYSPKFCNNCGQIMEENKNGIIKK